MSKAESVLALHAERCSACEIAEWLHMRVDHVRRIIDAGWWPWSRRRL